MKNGISALSSFIYCWPPRTCQRLVPSSHMSCSLTSLTHPVSRIPCSMTAVFTLLVKKVFVPLQITLWRKGCKSPPRIFLTLSLCFNYDHPPLLQLCSSCSILFREAFQVQTRHVITQSKGPFVFISFFVNHVGPFWQSLNMTVL